MPEIQGTPTHSPGESRMAGGPSKDKPGLVPPVDIYENEEGILLLADMPGVGKDGLDVHVDKNILTIKGEILDRGLGEADPLYTEFRGRKYERIFTLGPDVDVARIEAKMTSGVLTLMLPKTEAVKPRRIEVQTV